jgi:Homing endonuclease associated repeat
MKKEEVIEELQRVANKLETRSLSRSVFERNGTLSKNVVEQAFGSWNEAIVAAGLTPLPQGGTPKDERRRLERVSAPPTAGQGPRRIPDHELLEELLRLASVLGRRPSGNQVAAKGKYNPTVYQRRWGSLAAAYEAALARKGS